MSPYQLLQEKINSLKIKKEENDFIDNLQSLLKEDIDLLSVNHSRMERRTYKTFKHQSEV